ncbi:MAG: hypothetical protein ACE5HS_13745 [bacterium]
MITHQFQSNKPQPAKIPSEEYQAILERQKEDELNQLKRQGAHKRKVHEINKAHEDQLRKLFGSRKLERYRAYLANLRQCKADILLPPGNARDAHDKWQKIHLQHKAEASAFLRELEIDPQKIKELNLATQTQLQELVPPTPKRDGKPVTILLPAEVPFSADEPADENATLVQPPYILELTDADQFIGDNFDYRPAYALNATTGLTGGSSTLVNSDAGDFDYATAHFDTMVAFFYQMPATGLLEVWIEAQSGLSRHRLNLSDEWGWSYASAHQKNYLALKATSSTQTSETRLCEMSRFDVSDETDGFWNISPLTDGNSYWAHLFSSVPFEEGKYVLVQVGVRNFHSSFANDVEVDSTMEFNWFLKSVRLKSTGTP